MALWAKGRDCNIRAVGRCGVRIGNINVLGSCEKVAEERNGNVRNNKEKRVLIYSKEKLHIGGVDWKTMRLK